jgi:hypothetical protein
MAMSHPCQSIYILLSREKYKKNRTHPVNRRACTMHLVVMSHPCQSIYTLLSREKHKKNRTIPSSDGRAPYTLGHILPLVAMSHLNQSIYILHSQNRTHPGNRRACAIHNKPHSTPMAISYLDHSIIACSGRTLITQNYIVTSNNFV